MNITDRTSGEVFIIDLNGNIKEAEDLNKFSAMLEKALSDGWKKVLLNFHGVHFINSSGLGRLVMAVKKIAEVEGSLRVSNLGKELMDLFTFTRLKDKIPVYETEDEALQDF